MTLVQNSRILIGAAAEAAVSRIVHISITNPSEDSPLPYTISLGWGHKVCWKKLDVVFNPAPSGK